jgi:hypothetical protein
MDNNTILRIKVPANLYESVKEQLTLKESKNRLLEAISGTDEELMAFYEKVKQMEAEGTDLESAISYAKFDIENPDAAKELSSMNEAKKQNYGAGYSVVKEKKMKTPKDGMEKVEEDKGYMGTGYDSSEDMAVGMIKKETKEKDNSMEKKTRTLDELKKAKDALDEKINKMEMASKAPMNEDATEILMQLANTITDPDIINAIGRKLNMNSNELLNFFAGGTTLGTLGALLKRAANKDKERAKQG